MPHIILSTPMTGMKIAETQIDVIMCSAQI